MRLVEAVIGADSSVRALYCRNSAALAGSSRSRSVTSVGRWLTNAWALTG